MEGGRTFKQCRASDVKDKEEHQCCPTEEQVDALTWDLNSGRSREGLGGGLCSAFTPAVRGDIDLLNCTNAPPILSSAAKSGSIRCYSVLFHQAIFISVDLGMQGASRPPTIQACRGRRQSALCSLGPP